MTRLVTSGAPLTEARAAFPIVAPAAAKLATLVERKGRSGSTALLDTSARAGMEYDESNGDDASSSAPSMRQGGARGLTGRRQGPAGLPMHVSSTAAIPGYLAAMEVGGRGGGGRDSDSNTRVMAQWSRMRGVEAGISTVLGQSRYNSGDVAAKVHVSAVIAHKPKDSGSWVTKGDASVSRRVEKSGVSGSMAGEGFHRSRTWRPTPVESSRGTADTRMKKEARKIIQGLDLEKYNY